MQFWQRANIPTQYTARAIDKLEKLYREWENIQKGSRRNTETQKEKENVFRNKLDDLFDIAHANALEQMTIHEDKEFLQMQRQKGRPGVMIRIWPKKRNERRFEQIKMNDGKVKVKSKPLKMVNRNNLFSQLSDRCM